MRAKLFLIIPFLLFFSLAWSSIQAQEIQSSAKTFSQSKTFKGKLNQDGAIVLKKEQISIPNLNFETPNFYVQGYIKVKTYWVTTKVFINPDSLELETSSGLARSEYLIIILH